MNFLPSKSMMPPASGSIAPAIILMSVDLPAPFSPSRTCTSPAWISKEISFSAVTPGNFALLEFERYVVERHHAWIGLAYVLQLQHGRTLLSAYSAGVKVPDASSTVTTASPVALSMKLQRPG